MESRYINTFRGRVKAWLRGYKSEDFVLYNLDENPSNDYISTIQEKFKTPLINREYQFVLNNKLVFYKLLVEFKEHLPEIYFVILNGQAYSADSGRKSYNNTIKYLIDQKTDFVIKKIYGGGGQNIFIFRNHDNKIFLNGDHIADSEIYNMRNRFNNCLVTEYICQADYSKKIFTDSVNTIRLLTMWDIHRHEPFIAAAAHRFGTKKSNHVDNITAGGICSFIDISSGVLGKTYQSYQGCEIKWFNRHPDTFAMIKGSQIPRWKALQEKILRIANSLPMIPYIGWDIIAQDHSFKIIEANNHPGLNPLQTHVPLLKDKRIIAFYRHHQVIK
jgi:glutathione synthase/RimK-type ligase-like ATP-grasp enzyme